MKYGEYLLSQQVPEWREKYLDYNGLKKMIKDLEQAEVHQPADTGRATSLSVPRPTNAAGVPSATNGISHESFFAFLEDEMKKIETFTKTKVHEIRAKLAELEARVSSLSGTSALAAEEPQLRGQVEAVGENFLRLEKYVNLNFMGFHKILKKHDKHLPTPCRAFYTARMHGQSWVKGDYSDVIVTMSRVYSMLRGDEEHEAKEDAKQNFVRSTRKYWVHMEDISAIKYTILQHLPVFLQKTMDGETDSQLTNSVYLDNHAMELYHGRLDKTPGAIALRMRWYGTGTPDTVFVERKTHRESWTGEVSVKERFIVKEKQVLPLLHGTYNLEEEREKLRAKGKKEEDVEEWHDLASEIVQAISSKQLLPTMRTQYMRTAFQIPFDATVRISLDTNLTMICERTKETLNGERWYRDPNTAVPLNEITRFPHAILEIKLQLEDETQTPAWVTELLQSGKLLEVHKFSKFIHGCAVLMPEDVCALPYWIDDVTLADSITKSGAAKILEKGHGANDVYQQLLPHDEFGNVKKQKQSPAPVSLPSSYQQGQTNYGALEAGGYQQTEQAGHGAHCCAVVEENCCEWASSAEAGHMTVQKVEPKLILANERTFMTWMHMAVWMSSVATGVLAFTADGNEEATRVGMFFLPVALLFIIYAVRQFLSRGEKIKGRDAGRWDDPMGPMLLTVVLIIALVTEFIFKLVELSKQ